MCANRRFKPPKCTPQAEIPYSVLRIVTVLGMYPLMLSELACGQKETRTCTALAGKDFAITDDESEGARAQRDSRKGGASGLSGPGTGVPRACGPQAATMEATELARGGPLEAHSASLVPISTHARCQSFPRSNTNAHQSLSSTSWSFQCHDFHSLRYHEEHSSDAMDDASHLNFIW
jgi:hypothetical protein